MAEALGAQLVDMNQVQLHPTAFVDPHDVNATSRTLCAEVMRGSGGILLNSQGQRFVNEVGRRDDVTRAVQQQGEDAIVNGVFIVLDEQTGKDLASHVQLYSYKGLLDKVAGAAELAAVVGVEEMVIRDTLTTYNSDAAKGHDDFQKPFFRNTPFNMDGEFYIGRVGPAIHYTMGGVRIDDSMRALREDGTPIGGLYAVGEVSGGLHGENRLCGNSLLECTVFGRMLGQQLPIIKTAPREADGRAGDTPEDEQDTKPAKSVITLGEYQQHGTAEDCWVALYEDVYDFTSYLEAHPGGEEAILTVCGTMEGTDVFNAVHQKSMLEEFDEFIVGALQS